MTRQIHEGDRAVRPAGDIGITTLLLALVGHNNGLPVGVQAHEVCADGRRPTRLGLVLVGGNQHTVGAVTVIQLVGSQRTSQRRLTGVDVTNEGNTEVARGHDVQDMLLLLLLLLEDCVSHGFSVTAAAGSCCCCLLLFDLYFFSAKSRLESLCFFEQFHSSNVCFL